MFGLFGFQGVCVCERECALGHDIMFCTKNADEHRS